LRRVLERARRVDRRLHATVLATTLASALLVAACGNNQSPTGSGSGKAGGPTHSKVLAFSHCMRSNGVPAYPDPNSTNAGGSGIPKVSPQQLGVSASEFQAAQRTCSHLLPSGDQPNEPASQRWSAKMVRFARCMRARGVDNWPDPIKTPNAPPGAPPYIFTLAGREGLDGRSFPSQITAAIRGCEHVTHITMPYEG
jgi:hypothetical protein